jgi:hypothetical protein
LGVGLLDQRSPAGRRSRRSGAPGARFP